MDDIIIGRDEEDKKTFGTKGTILLGKHYVKMGQTSSLANNVMLDMIRPHVIMLAGKRGGGKSYTMGVIAEGLANMPTEVKQNLSIILLDTMGVYWTMKYENHKEADLLREYGMEPQGFNVHIYTPHKFYNIYKKQGIPTDHPFSIRPSELDAVDWCLGLGIEINSTVGVLLEKTIMILKS